MKLWYDAYIHIDACHCAQSGLFFSVRCDYVNMYFVAAPKFKQSLKKKKCIIFITKAVRIIIDDVCISFANNIFIYNIGHLPYWFTQRWSYTLPLSMAFVEKCNEQVSSVACSDMLPFVNLIFSITMSDIQKIFVHIWSTHFCSLAGRFLAPSALQWYSWGSFFLPWLPSSAYSAQSSSLS